MNRAFATFVLAVLMLGTTGGPAAIAQPRDRSFTPGVAAVLDEEIQLLKASLDNNFQVIQELKEQITKLQEELSKKDEAALARVSELEKQNKKLLDRLDTLEAARRKTEVAAAKDLADHKLLGGALTFDGRVRVRAETINNALDLSDDAPDESTFAGHRVQLGVRLRPTEHSELYVQAQDARVWGTEPDTLASDHGLGLHQGYVKFTDLFTDGLWLQAGRMEMSYGSERMIGASDFDPAGRSFDALRLGYLKDGIVALDVFVAKVAERGVLQDSDRELWGIYASTPYVEGFTFDLYTFLTNDNAAATDETVATVGARIGMDVEAGVFGEAEAAVQFGDRRGKDVLATAYAGELGYKLKTGPVPFDLSVFFSAASGDGNPFDDMDVDFDPLFPSRYTHWGRLNIATWRNLTDFGPRFHVTFLDDVTLGGEVHSMYLVTPYGTRFGLGAARATTDELTHLGEELDLLLRYAPWDFLTVEGGYSFFIPDNEGDLLKGNDRVDWLYLQVDARF